MANWTGLRILGFSTLLLLVGCASRGGSATQVSKHQEMIMDQSIRDRLSSVIFDENLTKAEADKLFGRGYPSGPAREAILYGLGPTYDLQLSFSNDAEQKLMRAIVTKGTVGPNPPPEILYNGLTKTIKRSCKDVKKSGLTAQELFEIWGPADGQFGSGIAFWQYWMADGRSASVTFSDGKATITCTD